MGITITNSAQNQLKLLVKNTNESIFYFGVISGGCVAFTYIFRFISLKEKEKYTKTPKNFKVFNYDDFKIVVDKKSYLYVNGTEIDWVDKLMGKHFEFHNPNVNSSCGCGESISFEIKEEGLGEPDEGK